MENSIDNLLENLKDVPAMPNVVIKALNIVKDPESSLKDLGEIISYDQSLCLHVLNLVNSAYFGFAQEITSITRALALLGMNRAKNIIIASAMKPMFASEKNKELWEHAITTAVGCEMLSEHLKIMDSDVAFMVGFMHDIGKLIINMQDETSLMKIQEMVDEGSDILETEDAFLGTNHAEIGAKLAKMWQLSVLLINTIKYHHNPTKSTMPVECALVYTVDKLVQPKFKNEQLCQDYVKILNIKLDDPRILRENILNKASILIDNLS